MTLLEQHVRNLEDLYAAGLLTMQGKRNDYSRDVDPFSNFREASIGAGIRPEQGILYMICTKIARLKNLLQPGKEPANESIEDTNMDLANYVNILNSFLKLRDQLPPLEAQAPVAQESVEEDEAAPVADEPEEDPNVYVDAHGIFHDLNEYEQEAQAPVTPAQAPVDPVKILKSLFKK